MLIELEDAFLLYNRDARNTSGIIRLLEVQSEKNTMRRSVPIFDEADECYQ